MSQPTETPQWQQKFIPGQTRDCIHGQHARKCCICELEHEIFDLNLELNAAQSLAVERLHTATDALAELATANRSITELEADKKRLDWIEQKTETHISKGGWGGISYWWLNETPLNKFPKSLRDAIDAARKQTL